MECARLSALWYSRTSASRMGKREAAALALQAGCVFPHECVEDRKALPGQRTPHASILSILVNLASCSSPICVHLRPSAFPSFLAHLACWAVQSMRTSRFHEEAHGIGEGLGDAGGE